MTALVRAEVRKLLTTRSLVTIAAVAVAYPLLMVVAAALAEEEPALGSGTLTLILLSGADVLRVAVLLLGIAAVAGEYRHGTIGPTLLAAPRRARLVTAKLGTLAVTGVALAVAAGGVALTAGAIYLSRHDAPVNVLSRDILLTAVGATLVAAFYAAIGSAVGAIVKNQTAAVAGALIWVLAVEGAVPIVLGQPGLRRWLPGGAADSLVHLADPIGGLAGPGAALALLAGLTIILGLAAVAVTRAADIQ